MNKILRKIKTFLKRYVFKNKIISILVGAIIIGLLIFAIINRTSVDNVKKVKKILSNKYYAIECITDECNYIIAYSGDKLGKSNIIIYNANGKKIASYKENFNGSDSSLKNIYSVTPNYIIFKKDNITSGSTESYIIANTKGKTKYTSENLLYSLNENLIGEKLDESYNIYNSNGKKLYTNVTSIKSQGDNKYISATVKNEEIILNEKGERILEGYRIIKQVSDDNENPIYFILQDSRRNAYYYYNIKDNSIVGDAFNSYVDSSTKGELIISKTANGETTKYILKQNGKIEKIEKVSMDALKNIDIKTYEIFKDSYIISSQQAVLVHNIKKNTFGIYNIKTNKYKKLFSYKEEYKNPSISKLLSNEKELYLQISCSNDNCKENKMFVYDMVNDKVVYEISNKDNEIQYFTNYGNYNVVKYSSNSSDEYKNKYAVYDKKNKEICRSNEQIVIIDKDIVFGKEPLSYSLVLFSSKENKIINSEESLANKVFIGKTYIYKYVDNNKAYLYNATGDKLKVINNSKTSLMYSTDTIIYIEDNKVFIVNPVDNRTKKYTLKENEKINTSDGDSIPPYRNTLFINNTVNNSIKVVNVNGRTIKNIKNSIIESVNYNKKTNNVIIITKQVKDNNNYYGLYLGK